MKIRLIRQVVVTGCPGVRVGDEFDAPDGVARDCLAQGLAVVVGAVELPKSDGYVAREPVIEHRDPEPEAAPVRKGRKAG